MKRGAVPRLALILSAAWLLVGLAPACAQTNRAAFWREGQHLCDAIARQPPGEHAAAIAREAVRQHGLWDGHRIDSAGRLHHFGAVEFEGEADRRASPSVPLKEVAWWRVWRYWAALDEARLIDWAELRVTAYAGAIGARDPDAPAARRDFAVATVLKALEDARSGSQEEALKQSAVRAMMSDLPWSAVFVSSLVHKAVPSLGRTEFAFSTSHMEYINQALERAKAEREGGSRATLYRACPIETTRPRPGDLLCYQRQAACAGASPADLRNLAAFGDPVPNRPECRAIVSTHCDVVARVDASARKVATIGGNVFQSVAERRMNLAGRTLALSANQGEAACRAARRREGDEPAAGEACSLNQRDWFVLLQAR